MSSSGHESQASQPMSIEQMKANVSIPLVARVSLDSIANTRPLNTNAFPSCSQ